MDIIELKKHIEENTLSFSTIILVCNQSTWLADQYINKYIDNNQLEKHVISSLSELTLEQADLLTESDNRLHLIRTDIFSEISDYSTYSNVIVICNKIDQKIKEITKAFVVEIPALQDWQLDAYIKTVCPELDDQHIALFRHYAGNDGYRIDSELDKLRLLPVNKHYQLLSETINSPLTDLYKIDFFKELIPAIIYKDTNVISNFLLHSSATNIDALQLVGGLLSKYKQILFLCYKSGVTAEDLGIKSGAAYYTRKEYSTVTEASCRKAIEFLSSINKRLSLGELEFDNNSLLLSYIINNLM